MELKLAFLNTSLGASSLQKLPLLADMVKEANPECKVVKEDIIVKAQMSACQVN